MGGPDLNPSSSRENIFLSFRNGKFNHSYYAPNFDMEDVVKWKPTANIVVSAKSAWEATQKKGPNLYWHKLVWNNNQLPNLTSLCGLL